MIFVDQENHLVAYTPVWAMRQRLSKPVLGDELLEVIQHLGRRNELFNYPNMYRETVKPDSKRIEAMQSMDKLSLSAIPIVDDNGICQGVVEREKVVSQMILKLAEKSTK